MDFVDDEDERREIEKDFAALDIMSKARFNFERLICAASRSQDEAVLESLRLEKMFEFAQFFFTIDALGLKGPNDAGLLADLHNDQLEKLLKDKIALRRRGLTADRVLKAIFTSDTKPRLEQIWREILALWINPIWRGSWSRKCRPRRRASSWKPAPPPDSSTEASMCSARRWSRPRASWRRRSSSRCAKCGSR